MYIQAEATKNREWKISRMGNSFCPVYEVVDANFEVYESVRSKVHIHNNFQGALIQTQDLKD